MVVATVLTSRLPRARGDSDADWALDESVEVADAGSGR
jgi:hypothetical protein